MKFFTRSRLNFINTKRLSMLFLALGLFLLSGNVGAQCTAVISGGSSPICSGTSPGTFTATGTGDPGPYTLSLYHKYV
jgi:hypothetical protein